MTTVKDAREAGLRCNCPGDYYENGGHNIYCPLGIKSVVRDALLAETRKGDVAAPDEDEGEER